MLNIKELYILANENNPIQTPIGNCYPVSVKQWDKLLIYEEWLNKDKYDVINDVKAEDRQEANRILNEITFYDFIITYLDFGYYKIYKDMFEFFFHEDVFDKIQNQEQFEQCIQLIKNINCINTREKKSINPEIAYFDKLEQISKEKKGEIVTMKSMVANVGLYRHDVLNMSIYQLHSYFDAINVNKNFDAGNLFKTVSSERIEVKPWYFDPNIEQTQLDNEDKKFIQGHLLMVKDNPEKKGFVETLNNK